MTTVHTDDDTDEYDTDDWHKNPGDSSEDELVNKQKTQKESGRNSTCHNNNNNATKAAAASSPAVGSNGVFENEKKNDDEEESGPDGKRKPSCRDDDSEQESNRKNKRGRMASGRVIDNNNNAKNKNSSRNNSNNTGHSSDSDSNYNHDDYSDDLGLGLGSNKQSLAARSRKRAALMQMYSSSSSSDSDEDSSDNIIGKKRKQSNRRSSNSNNKKKAAPPSRAKAIELDSSSDSNDSDSDCVDIKCSFATRAKPTFQARASAAVAVDCCNSSDSDEDISHIPSTTRAPATLTNNTPPSPSSLTKTNSNKTDEGLVHHDPSVRANSNATLEAARRAKAALLQSQVYHAEDVTLPPLPSQVVSKKVSSPDVLDLVSNEVNHPISSYTGLTITIYLRYKDSVSDKESKVNLKIKTDQPLQHLVDQFQQGKITQMKFDGQNLDLTKSPSFYDMDDEDLVDAVIANSDNNKKKGGGGDKVVIHVRGSAGARNETYEIKKLDPLKKIFDDYCKKNHLSAVTLEYNGRKLDMAQSCSQLGISNDAFLDATVASGPLINLIFRVNGKANDTVSLSIRLKDMFQQAMETFAQRRNVSVSQCKFLFDGEALRPSSTPEMLDLEGDEIIDVTVTECAILAPPRATNQSAPAATLTASAPAVMITIDTNRNQNNNPRQKKWKLLDTSLISKLKTDYFKYYKSKGCNQVQFYFRNSLIQNESKSLRELGISDGDTVYAIENGQAYNLME